MSVISVPVLLSRGATRLERFLALLVLAFAGLTASFIARNSDIWQHLALGRIVSAGDYDFHSDPIGYAATTERWVNHNWLLEWMSYQLFRTAGGLGLMMAKVLLVMFIVALAIRSLDANRPRWLALLFMAGAISIWAQRLTLQPILISCLGLCLVLHCLRVGGRAHRYIPAIILLWVNLDEWYILGPLVVLLWWLGSRLDQRQSIPNWLPVASILVCLMSPFHLHGLTLPAELSPTFWWSELAQDSRLSSQFASPFSSSHRSGWIPESAAAGMPMAMLVITVLLLGFKRRVLGMSTVLVSLLLIALACWQARLIPFFAVVSLTLLAPGIQAVTLADRRGRLGRGLTLVTILACVGAVWLGRFPGARDRILGFDIVADPSWIQAAETIQDYRRQGVIPPEARILTTSPDATNTLYWFAAGEKGWLDTRWGWHSQNTRIKSLDIGREFGLSPDTTEFTTQQKIQELDIALVLVADSTPGVLQPLLTKASAWRILKLDGRSAWIVPRKIQARPSRLAQIRFAPEEMAFGQHPEPSTNLGRMAQHPVWWLPMSRHRWIAGADAAKAEGYLDFSIASQSPNPALALLAIRSARKAIASQPDDAHAWFELGRAYAVLATNSERSSAASGFHLEFRRVQRITTLAAAAIANPELEPVREALAATFAEFGYLDFSLTQRQYQYQLLLRRGEIERARIVKTIVEELEATLLDRESLYLIRTKAMSGEPLNRARIALELGLARQAEETLLKSSPELFGADGLRMLARLLLMTGQASEANVLLDRQELKNNPSVLGFAEIPCQDSEGKRKMFRLPAYAWFRFLLDSSTGQGDPRSLLAQFNNQLSLDEATFNQNKVRQLSSAATRIAEELGLATASLPIHRAILIQFQNEQLIEPITQGELFLNVVRGELAVLEGILELESGNTEIASLRFQTALGYYDRIKSEAKIAPSRRLAEQYRNQIEKQRLPR